jgi:hypothetical protein
MPFDEYGSWYDDPAALYENAGYDEDDYDEDEPAVEELTREQALALAYNEIDTWLNAIGEGRALSAADREAIFEAADQLMAANPGLALGEALSQGFGVYEQANSTSWARETEGRLMAEGPGARPTPKGEHGWYDDLNRRELVRTNDPDLRAWGQSTAMREANELAAWRLAAARRMDDTADRPAFDMDTARSIALDAMTGGDDE